MLVQFISVDFCSFVREFSSVHQLTLLC